LVVPLAEYFNHENTKLRKHEIMILNFFRVFVLSCFRDFFYPTAGELKS